MGLAATRPLLIATLACAAAAIAAVAEPAWWPAVIALDGVVALVAAIDLAWTWPVLAGLRGRLTAPRVWSRDRAVQVLVDLDVPHRLGVRLEVVPDLPRALVADPPLREVAIPGRRRAQVAFQVTGTRRGTVLLRGVHVRLASRLGLWRLSRRLGEAVPVAVHPDLRQVADYALLAREDRLDLIGVRRARRTGGDTEFERLRDHHSDDPLNRIDWKATARRERLTVRDYQTSQCQAMTLLVDAGRLMGARTGTTVLGGGTRALLDHAIDAALLLAWVALTQRDRVGLIAYSDGIRRRIPAGGGPRRFQQLVHALHDLEAEPVLSRHDEALATLARTERKRSLVVLLTQVLDEVSAGLLERHCASLTGRHLPRLVLIRDDDLHAAGALPDDDPAQAGFWLSAASASVLNARNALMQPLRATGCLVLDVAPAELTPSLVTRYLEIKAKNLL